jgi:hypothetical protein
MLRMLQVDLAQRTAEFERQLSVANEVLKQALQQEGRELAAEQGRLAELVQTMMRRDNEEQEER